MADLNTNQEVVGPTWDQCPPEWAVKSHTEHNSGYVGEYRAMLSDAVTVDLDSVD